MDIPDGEFWAGVGAVISAGVAFAFWAARNFMTRSEHARLLADSNAGVQRQLKAIEELVKEQRDESREHRNQVREDREYDRKEQRDFQHDIRESLNATGLRVAIIEGKLGMQTKGQQ